MSATAGTAPNSQLLATHLTSSPENRKSPPRGLTITCTSLSVAAARALEPAAAACSTLSARTWTATLPPTASTTALIMPTDGVVPPSTKLAQSSTLLAPFSRALIADCTLSMHCVPVVAEADRH